MVAGKDQIFKQLARKDLQTAWPIIVFPFCNPDGIFLSDSTYKM